MKSNLISKFVLASFTIIISVYFLHSGTLPHVEVDPITGSTTFTFYNGPAREVDDGNGNMRIFCDNPQDAKCKVIVVEGISGTTIPSGTTIDIWSSTAINPKGFLGCVLTKSFNTQTDTEVEFHRDVLQTPITNYNTWHNLAINN